MKSQLHSIVWLVAVMLWSTPETGLTQDNIPPSIRCKTGVVIVLPANGEIIIDAEDFDDGTTDNVTAAEDLKFYLNNNPNKTSHRVTCDSFEKLGVLEEYVEELFFNVEDEAGNVSICEVELIVQDNKYICGRPELVCTGCIVPWNDMNELPVRINCQNDTSSCYSIVVDRPKTLELCRNWDHLNGVSTADIVRIQRHLLGLASFESPWQYIAADVNNTESVSAGDISTIRKLVLGVIDDFEDYNLSSWRFFRETDQDITEELSFNDTLNCPDNTNVVALKVGDVNPDGGFSGDAQPREEDWTYCQTIASAHSTEVEFYVENNVTVSGFQLEFMVDEKKDDLLVTSRQLGNANLYYFQKEGLLKIIWHHPEGGYDILVGDQPILQINTNSRVSFNSGEIYTHDIKPVELIPRVEENKDRFTISPNPSSNDQPLFIEGDDLPDEVEIIGVNGEVKHVSLGFKRGKGTLAAEHFDSGVNFVRLVSKGKMVILKVVRQ